MKPDELTDDEVGSLYKLLKERGEIVVGGNVRQQGLDRLVDARLVECRHVAADANLYILKPDGLVALRSRKVELPAPKRNEWPNAFLCICRHGTQSWHDEQGIYRCDHCSAWFSGDPLQENLQWVKDGEVRSFLPHTYAWIRGGIDAKPIRLGYNSKDH